MEPTEALAALGFKVDPKGIMKKLINQELGIIATWHTPSNQYRFTLDTWIQVDFFSKEVNKKEIEDKTIEGLEAVIKVLVSTLKGLKDVGEK